MQTTEETIVWEGVALPLWHFDTFDEFDYFMDTLMAVEQSETADAWFAAEPMSWSDGRRASGVLFGSAVCYSLGLPVSPTTVQAAIAIVAIREDLPQEERQ